MMFWAVLGLYFGLNFVLNYGNKYLLVVFPFPVTVILLGTLVYAPLAALVIFLSGQSFPSRSVMWATLPETLLLGLVHAVTAAAQNVSLAGMSVGLNQVIKACTPAVTLVLSRVMLRSRFHWTLVAATFGVVLGVALTTYSSRADGHVSPIAIALGFLSALAGGGEGVLIGLLMKRHAVTPAQVTLLCSWPALLSLLPVFFGLEAFAAVSALATVGGLHLLGATLILSVAASAYALSHAVIIQWTSAHYCNLINALKLVMVVGLSFFWIDRGSTFSVTQVMGLVLTMASFTAYSVCRSLYPEDKSACVVETKKEVQEVFVE